MKKRCTNEMEVGFKGYKLLLLEIVSVIITYYCICNITFIITCPTRLHELLYHCSDVKWEKYFTSVFMVDEW